MPSSVVARELEHKRQNDDAGPRYPFWFGGAAAAQAALLSHPLDLGSPRPLASTTATANPGVVKVRLQTSVPRSRSMLQTVLHVFHEQGLSGFYKGLSASLLRQATYSTTRFGVYESAKQHVAGPPSFPVLLGLASTSGFLGGLAGNPADVLNVRMQNDASLPLEQRRNYRHAIDGLFRMIREEGWRSLFRGVGPNSARAALMTATQLASYDKIKQVLLAYTPMRDNLITHLGASTAAGLIATTCCSPFDVLKTKMMSAAAKETLLSALVSIYRRDGLSWVFRGWLPSFVRLGPQTVFTFIFLEQYRALYRKLKE